VWESNILSFDINSRRRGNGSTNLFKNISHSLINVYCRILLPCQTIDFPLPLLFGCTFLLKFT
jgi:hypothetical protein